MIEDSLARIANVLEILARQLAAGATLPGIDNAPAVAAEPKRRGRPPGSTNKPAEPAAEEVAADDGDTPADPEVEAETEAEPVVDVAKPKGNAKEIEAKRQALKVAFKALIAKKGHPAAKTFLGKMGAAVLTAIPDNKLDAAKIALAAASK